MSPRVVTSHDCESLALPLQSERRDDSIKLRPARKSARRRIANRINRESVVVIRSSGNEEARYKVTGYGGKSSFFVTGRCALRGKQHREKVGSFGEKCGFSWLHLSPADQTAKLSTMTPPVAINDE